MTVFEITEVRALPHFEPSRCVKHALFARRGVDRVNYVMRTYQRYITVSYFAGSLLFPLVMLGPAEIGRYAALIEAILEAPSYIAIFLSLRADLLLHLLASYDFWFFSTVTMLFTTSFSLILGDMRMVLVIHRWLGFAVPILIDANMNQIDSLLQGVQLNMGVVMFAMVAVTLRAIDQSNDAAFKLSEYRSLSARDILLNAMVTMEILLIRIVVRKRHQMQTSRARGESAKSIMMCVTLQCSIKLQPVQTTSTTAISMRVKPSKTIAYLTRILPAHTHRRKRRERTLVQLRRTPTTIQFDSRHIVVPALMQAQFGRLHLVALYAVGCTGLVLTAMTMWRWQSAARQDIPVFICALVFTVSFMSMFVAFYQRRLLLHICTSFDFAFLSIQLTLAHICVCDMLAWQLGSTIGSMCMWLWIIWIITLDALTPSAKQKLAFRLHWIAVPIILMYASGLITFGLQGLIWNTWNIRDRIIFKTHALGCDIAFGLGPFCASRLITVLVWCFRLMYRICHELDPGILVMLRGQIEFEYVRRAKAREAIKSTAIQPIAIGPSTPGTGCGVL